jgi:murein DD-endopeptidase MepM/ murein hydrolase activator NlpD
MRLGKLGLSFLYTSLMFCSCLFGQGLAIAAETPQPAQVMVDIYDPPVAFEALDKMYLAYELYLTNFYNSDITIDALQVHDKDTDTPLLGFDKNSLRKMVRKTCTDNTVCDELVIPPGGMKLVYLLLPFNSQNDLPKEIVQRLFITRKDNNSQAELKTLPLKVNKANTVMVRPPVKGDYWVAVNGLAPISLHRTAHWVMNGQNYFAQRYAVDFMQIDLDGKYTQGSEQLNDSYYAYGKEVSAVARGTVVAVKDGIPDNKPQLSTAENKAGNRSAEEVAGNYVVLELGKGLYAFYGHLRPGSIQVKVGEKVMEGHPLAQIGNSGNSKLPHLHFQIADRPAYLAGNGIPYTFTEFWVRPSEIVDNGPQKLFKFSETPDGLKRYNNQAFLENTVLKFNDEDRYSKERRSAFSDDDDNDDVKTKPRAVSGNNNYGRNEGNGTSAVIKEDVNFRQSSTRMDPNNPSNPNNPNNFNNPNMQKQQQQYVRPTVSRNSRAVSTKANKAEAQRPAPNREPLFQGLRSLFGVD